MFKVFLSTILAVALLPGTCLGEKRIPTEEDKIACLKIRQKSNSARAANDWKILKKFANETLSSCKNMFDDAHISSAYEELAMTSIKLKDPTEGLRFSISCIEADYENTSCHLYKVESLQALNRKDEAGIELSTSLRLIEHKLQRSKYELSQISDGTNKENQESLIKLLELQRDFAKLLTEELPEK